MTSVKIKGTLDGGEPKKTKDGKDYLLVDVQGIGEKLFLWTPGLLNERKIKVGDQVEVEYEPGKYPKIIDINKLPEDQQRTLTNAPASGYNPDPGPGFQTAGQVSKEDLIIRQACLKATCNLISRTTSPELLGVENVLRISAYFEKWVHTGAFEPFNPSKKDSQEDEPHE